MIHFKNKTLKKNNNLQFYIVLMLLLFVNFVNAQIVSKYLFSESQAISINSPYMVEVSNTQDIALNGEIIGTNLVYIRPSNTSSLVIKPEPTTPSSPLPGTTTGTTTGGTGSAVRVNTGGTGLRIGISQFPNPTIIALQVSITNGAAVGYKIYDTMGVLRAEENFNTLTQDYTINVENLPPGLYMQKINFGYNAYETVQFIK
jgi:hypothetical protein